MPSFPMKRAQNNTAARGDKSAVAVWRKQFTDGAQELSAHSLGWRVYGGF